MVVTVWPDDGGTINVPLVFWLPPGTILPWPVLQTEPAWTPKALPRPAVTLDAWRTLNRMNARLREQTLFRVSPVLLRPPPRLKRP